MAIGAVSIPVAMTTTVLLIPFWRWLEATTGTELSGHSGPSGGCFIAIYLLILAAGFSVWRLFQK